MEKKRIHWKRYNHAETGFKLIEVMEDGEIVKRTHGECHDEDKFYCEKDRETFDAGKEIRLDKVDFGKDHKLEKDDIADAVKVLETFEPGDWQAARERVKQFQKEVEDDLSTDYHTLLVLDADKLDAETNEVLKETKFPIVLCRYKRKNSTMIRVKHPDEVRVEYVAALDEKLYFHHHPESKHLNMTGDDLFALHAVYYKDEDTENVFDRYVDDMLKDVHDNIKYYRRLIDQQRNRRAMHDTDMTGDLYPK